MTKMGRKLAVLDWKKIEHFIMSGCHGTEVASYYGIHPNTLYSRCEKENGISFTQYLQEKRSKGNCALHTAQFEEAVVNRNITMLIWLGKCRLKQREKEEVSLDENSTIEIVNYGESKIIPWVQEKGEDEHGN